MIKQIGPDEAQAMLPQLLELLRDAVNGGASVGFLPPLSDTEGTAYWNKMVSELRQGGRVMWVALHQGELQGSVQLSLAAYPNSTHRAEVQKLLVFSHARNRGWAKQLMQALEGYAQSQGRTLLILDTLQGHLAESLYRKWGWSEVGAVPNFAKVPGGKAPTVFFYKEL